MMSELSELKIVDISKIEAARKNISDLITRTPLIAFPCHLPDTKIYLKLENLQPVGSFKLRGAGNALRCLRHDALADGVYSASMGNFAQGICYAARQMNTKCTIIAPHTAAKRKLDAILAYGAELKMVSYEDWWNVLTAGGAADARGQFVHPVCDENVIAGNGTIGLEILEDLDDVDAIVCPVGGGGLVSGIASAVKQRQSSVRVLACEVDVAAPLKASFAAGEPVTLKNHKTTFIDGIGGRAVLPPMWNLLRHLVDDSLLVGVHDVARAVRLLLEDAHVLAEGAGAAPLAAALAGKAGAGNIVCVVSGGNIDSNNVIDILKGYSPGTTAKL